MTDATSLFEIAGDALVATELSRGPWDPNACHGGPVAALLVRECEQFDPGPWQLARITVELVRPVPVAEPLISSTLVERPGRNVSLTATSLARADGTEVAKARALRIRTAPVPLSEAHELEAPPSRPGDGEAGIATMPVTQTAFHADAVDLHFTEGSWLTPGPVFVWCRLRHPVVPGETPSGRQRVAACADFSNGVSSELDALSTTFINPDLTIHFAREPEGEWIGMRAQSFYGPEGAGLAEGSLFDGRGRCARSVQSLILATR
jgi:hypothetical protein